MRRPSFTTRRTPVDLQLTPMIDCVFLLLIFFMTTASFVETERELNPAIKVQRAAAKAAGDFQPAVIDVVKGSSGRFVYGTIYGHSASFSPSSALNGG